MCRLYSFVRVIANRWLLFAVVLIFLTFLFGMIGFARQKPENSYATNFYSTILLFALNCEKVGNNVDWDLEIARWLGMIVWFFTIASVLIQLFSQPALALFVAFFSWRGGHVIVAGLGEPESERDRLVERLRAQGRNVVVIEEDAVHPGLETCRQAGAICLIGSPFESAMLQKAQIRRAGTLLALREDDRKNIKVLSLAAALVGTETPPSAQDDDPLAPLDPNNLGCVIQVGEPRLLEVLGRHDLNRDCNDRLHLRFFNVHEMVARAMLRECMIGLEMPTLKKVLLLGTGESGRLGEALVLRATKDRWIDAEPGAAGPLQIDVCDDNADEWVRCIRSGMDEPMAEICRLTPMQRPASRCGFRGAELRGELDRADYDAAFVCMPHESHALIQAAELREVLPPHIPIIVQVHDETAGFGALLQRENAGGLGPNIHVVGSHDRVFDLVASMNPRVEMVAQVLHQDYLILTQRKIRAAMARGERDAALKLAQKAAFQSWPRLSESYRESNRALARRLRAHLTVPGVNGHPGRRFRLEFAPRALISPGDLFQLSEVELEALARQEHDLWMQTMTAVGWRRGADADPYHSNPERKLNPNLVPWEQLDEDMKEYDRNVIRRLPFVFAKADYKIVRFA